MQSKLITDTNVSGRKMILRAVGYLSSTYSAIHSASSCSGKNTLGCGGCSKIVQDDRRTGSWTYVDYYQTYYKITFFVYRALVVPTETPDVRVPLWSFVGHGLRYQNWRRWREARRRVLSAGCRLCSDCRRFCAVCKSYRSSETAGLTRLQKSDF